MANPGTEPLLIVAICSAFALVLLWLRKRGLLQMTTRSQSGGKQLRVVSRLALTPQHSLHLVQLGEETILLAASPSGCQRLEARGLDR